MAMGGRERDGERNGVNGGAGGGMATVPLHRMFAFADRTDAALMAVGTVTTVANGMAQPILTYVFGDVVNAFSSVDGPSPDVLHRVTKPPRADDMGELPIPAVDSLPLETRYPLFPVRQYGGFWLPEFIFPGVAAVHDHGRFVPRPDDVFLASFPKSGTTWLKALAFATLHRDKHPPCRPDHPLRHGSPHDCVKFIELALSADDAAGVEELAALPTPRVLATHVPYTLLPGRMTAEGTGCRIVYVCRDPKDALVSWWLFTKKKMAPAVATGGNTAADDPQPPPFTIEEAFELFCDGRCAVGPQWDHVVGYWEASKKGPEKVLFLWYERMLQDPLGTVRKLAEFMGRPFSGEEEASGVAQDIVELCSLDSLKNMEANKTGSQKTFKNESFFRKGVAGDWSNHMTPAMAARLDKIVEDALQGSGFSFGFGESA